MESIHPLSSTRPLSIFDIFAVPPTQDTIEKDILNEYRPISTLDSKSFIEFNITSGAEEYIRLDKTVLYLRLRINLAKPLNLSVSKDDWKKISTVNNLMNSLFQTNRLNDWRSHRKSCTSNLLI